MPQYDPDNFVAAGTSGTDLVVQLNLMGAAYLSLNSGNTAPTYATFGTLWRDTSVTPNAVRIYDGVGWILKGVIDDTNDLFIFHTPNYKQSTAPTGAGVGTQWIDDSPSDGLWEMNVYDGADWILVGHIDSTANKFYVPILDEDDFVSDSPLLAPSQQSAAAYIATYVASLLEKAIFTDQKAQNTDGGTSVGLTWNIRDLNNTEKNNITGCSLSSNQITLPAGTYKIRANAPAWSANQHQLSMYNVTDATYDLVGSAAHAAVGRGTTAFMTGIITIVAEKVFELRHYTSVGSATVGLGNAVNATTEVYGIIEIEKQ